MNNMDMNQRIQSAHATIVSDVDAHHVEPAGTVGELIDVLRGLPRSLPVLDSFSDPLKVVITADYVDVGP